MRNYHYSIVQYFCPFKRRQKNAFPKDSKKPLKITVFCGINLHHLAYFFLFPFFRFFKLFPSGLITCNIPDLRVS